MPDADGETTREEAVARASKDEPLSWSRLAVVVGEEWRAQRASLTVLGVRTYYDAVRIGFVGSMSAWMAAVLTERRAP